MKRIANYLIVLTLAVFAFTSCEDVPSPFGQIVAPKSDEGEVIEPSGKGTLAEPYNVAGVIEYLSGLGADVPSPTDVYIKGVITSITEAFGTQYGNATFEISDTENASNKFLCYRVKYLGNTSYSDPSALNIKQGNTVIICGKVVNYKGNTPETSANAAYVYSINGQGGSGGGGGDTPSGKDIGSKDSPITCAKALELISALADGGESDGNAFVKGKVVKVTTNADNFAKYGNLNYLISDNGSETNAITVYSGDGLNGEKFKSITDLAAGDEVIVFGKLYKYVNKDGKMTPEINKGNYLVSLVKGGGGGGGDTPTPTGTMTKSVAGTVVTFTSSSVTGSDEVTVDFNAQGWEDKSAPTTVTLSNGTTIEFGGGENTSNSPVFYSATKGVRVYAKNTITVKGSKSIAKIVMNCDSYNGTDYVGNEMLYAKEEGKTVTICNDHTEAKGGVQVRVQTMVITFEGEGSGGGDTPTPSGDTGLEASFASGEGDFTIDNKDIGSLSYVWKADSKGYMKASAYVNNANNAAESWLVSPAFSLKGISAPVMTFNNACNYVKEGTITDHIKVMVYDGATWTEATIANLPDGKSWTFVDSTVDLKAIAGKEGVKIAFKYVSTTAVAPTWEIKTVSVK